MWQAGFCPSMTICNGSIRRERCCWIFPRPIPGFTKPCGPGDPTVYFLTNLGLAGTTVATPADMAGSWVMTRPQTRLACQLTLDDGVLGGGSSPMEERLVLKPSDTCEKSFNGLRLFALAA